MAVDGVTTPDDLAGYTRRLAAVLGDDLTAYVAGADSIGQLDIWVSSRDVTVRQRVLRRLIAAGDVIRIFSADNLLSFARPWLREVGPAGQPAPARLLRRHGEDHRAVKHVLHSATQWVGERRHAPITV
jgi:hypothetical protein